MASHPPAQVTCRARTNQPAAGRTHVVSHCCDAIAPKPTAAAPRTQQMEPQRALRVPIDLLGDSKTPIPVLGMHTRLWYLASVHRRLGMHKAFAYHGTDLQMRRTGVGILMKNRPTRQTPMCRNDTRIEKQGSVKWPSTKAGAAPSQLP